MTLALIIIFLMVLLVIVDETDTSGHGSEDGASQAEEAERSTSGSPCILAVTSICRRDPKETRRHAWRKPRGVETESAPR